MNLNNVIVAGGAAYRLRIVVCGNDEVLSQDLHFESESLCREDRQEIGTLVVRAAADALDKFDLQYEIDCCFAHWRGGKFCNPMDLGRFPVFVAAYRLEWDEDNQEWIEEDHAVASTALTAWMDAIMDVVRAAVDKAVEMCSAIDAETE